MYLSKSLEKTKETQGHHETQRSPQDAVAIEKSLTDESEAA